MPLHDWAELSGWEGMHLLWMSELLRHVTQGRRLDEARENLDEAVALIPDVNREIAKKTHD
jgi:hypothetical protein